jgi:hypothetical protein
MEGNSCSDRSWPGYLERECLFVGTRRGKPELKVSSVVLANDRLCDPEVGWTTSRWAFIELYGGRSLQRRLSILEASRVQISHKWIVLLDR